MKKWHGMDIKMLRKRKNVEDVGKPLTSQWVLLYEIEMSFTLTSKLSHFIQFNMFVRCHLAYACTYCTFPKEEVGQVETMKICAHQNPTVNK